MKRTLHVLLVENDANEAASVATALTTFGHTVQAVDTVDAAHSALSARHSIDVIVMDLQLGNERGESIFERLTLGGIVFPPVIILSAELQSRIAKAADRIKGASVLRKPATGPQIFDAINAAMASYNGWGSQ